MNPKTIIRSIKRWPVAAVVAWVVAGGTVRGDDLKTGEEGRSASVASESGRILIEAHTSQPEPRLFFSAVVAQEVHLGREEIAGEAKLKIQILQGRPEMVSLGLSGAGEVVDVSGNGLRDWAVRRGASAGSRFLDLHPVLAAGAAGPRELVLVVHTRLLKPVVPGTASVLVITPGDAVGFASRLTLQPDPAVDFRVTSAQGMVPVGEPNPARGPVEFSSTTGGNIEVRMSRRGTVPAEAELLDAQLIGRVNETARSVDFRLRAQLRAQKSGARVRLLSGRAALSEKAAGDGWHVELVENEDENFYELVADRQGVLPIDLSFTAAVEEDGDWRKLEFEMPAGAVVPLRLEGLPASVEFSSSAAVVPTLVHDGWQGFLPANGVVAAGWKHARKADEGALFFTSSEQTEVRVGAGLLRQESQITFRLMQGKLAGVRLRLDGPGEILGVVGPNVIGWTVLSAEAGGARILEVRLSRPLEGEGSLVVRSQSVLDSFPVRAEALRLSPEATVRHSGYVRVANNGAVRLEITDVNGMMQLGPTQFPGAAIEEGARQVFVYRFPSANYGYRVAASQIQAETAVSQIVTYELTETDRVINADLELDVREAPLHDWTLKIPEAYAVVAVAGNNVVDNTVESEAKDGYRALKILFDRAVEGRQLLKLRLEKNQAAGAGEWRLPPLQFPGAKSVRGHIGAVSTPGYRIVPLATEQLVDIPVSFFPRQTASLQQAWRLREPDWKAAVRLELLGQSIQADVFHLYSLREGVVYGSVLFNYFVVGAPVGEWRIEVPESAGNIDVVGQNVRRDWRREGNQIVVSLHQPVLGAATLLITFEQPMSARGGSIHPGELRPLNVQGERGFVHVVSPLQVKHTVLHAEGGLLKLEPMELPAEFRLLTNSPSLAVYQYTARPFNLELGIEWYPRAEMVDQVVDFAKFSSQVSRDGQVVTEGRFFVKTRGRQTLRLSLPTGVSLWEVRVDNEVVTARTDRDQTLVPLPARMNPNEPVAIALRLGQAAAASGMVTLREPRLQVPVIIDEWTIRGDAERLLVPKGGNAELLHSPLTETGFEWIAARGRNAFGMLCALVVLAGLLLRGSTGWKAASGLATCAVAVIGAVMMAFGSLATQRANLTELVYSAAMRPVGEPISIQLANVPVWRAMISWWGCAAVALGLGFLVAARLSTTWSRWLVFGGVMLSSVGLLVQRPGAALFFGASAAALFVLVVLPGTMRLIRAMRKRDEVAPPTGAGPATALSLLVLLGCGAAGIVGAPAARAEETAARPVRPSVAASTAQSITQSWRIHDRRLFAELEFSARGTVGGTLPLLSPPAVLTDFRADGLRVSKIERDGRTSYFVVFERDGLLTARARYEMAVPSLTQPLPVPTGPAALQRLTIDLDQAGWEFWSETAVQVLPTAGLASDHSGATLTLAPAAGATVEFSPQQRNLQDEATKFFAETSNLYLPGPGGVNGYARVTVRPAQGRVTELELSVPEGFTIGEVGEGPVGAWRFDPGKRRLTIAVEPAQTAAFKFNVEMQRGTGALPYELSLEPLRVPGAVGDVGMIAIGFGGDAQPEGIRATGISPVSTGDFDSELMPRGRDDQPLAVVQQAWRYGREDGRVELKVTPVAPEVRVTSRQLLSLDDDRLVAAVDMNVAITRVGLFKLSFVLPAGLEVEALSGPALNHWTEAQENGQRVITLHLSGRTIGEQHFNLTLAGAAPRAQAAWPVPRFLMREATRQTGELLLVPGKGIRLHAVDRQSATQLDPRSVGGMQPGTLAFRLLQDDWALHVGIETMDAWVTVNALQEFTVREGQTLTRIAARYRIENAAVKQMRLRLPGLTEDQVRTVRATGSAVTDFVRTAGDPDGWEVHFQSGIAGETDVQVEFQGMTAGQLDHTAIATPVFVGSRQTTLFVAVRSGGRLELEPAGLPAGWQNADWSAVPANLQNPGDRSVPVLCYRVAEPERALPVGVRRHDAAEALKLRVTGGEFTTLFSPEGASLTAIDLKMDVIEKTTLRVRLPEGAQLFNTFMNGDSASVVREGNACLFHVAPNSTANRSATVRLVYAVPGRRAGRIPLTGPRFDVPLENVVWHVVLPPGYELGNYRGSLRLREDRTAGAFGVEQYQAMISSVHSAEAKKASALFDEASALVKRGEQQQAGEVLSRAAKNTALDQASNEDARVQLRELKTQQAVLGLNTRRQRLYLDHRGDTARNEQLEQAANLNPFMQGRINFDPQQVDQLLMGNTVEENTALRGIASRIVEQQLAAEPAPSAIDVTLPERGHILTFTRSLQVDGKASLELTLEIARVNRMGLAAIVMILAGLGLAVAMMFSQKGARAA